MICANFKEQEFYTMVIWQEGCAVITSLQAKEITLWVKHLSYKCEDQSSDLWNPSKMTSGHGSSTIIPAHGRGRRRSSRANWLAGLTKLRSHGSLWEVLPQCIRWKWMRKGMLLTSGHPINKHTRARAPTHMYIHAHPSSHAHMHVYMQKKKKLARLAKNAYSSA